MLAHAIDGMARTSWVASAHAQNFPSPIWRKSRISSASWKRCAGCRWRGGGRCGDGGGRGGAARRGTRDETPRGRASDLAGAARVPAADALLPAEATDLTLAGVAPTPEATPAPTPTPALAAPDLAEIRLPVAIENPLAGIRDDVDTQVLAIFLEEAAELYPQAGEQVRALAPQPQRHRILRSNSAARCIRSRAARGWRARCVWASSRT